LGKEKRREKKRGAVPMNLSVLTTVREELKKSGWAEGSRACLWAACLVAFWGAVRLSEILPKGERIFDRFSDLLWENVEWKGENGMRLEIRGGKVPGPPGNCIRLFAVRKQEFCPIVALKALEEYQKTHKIWKRSMPVFRRASGKNLTKSIFLKAVNALLEKKGKGQGTVGGKSFRCGIPSSLENFLAKFCENHLKSLGRWRSRAYQRYMKNDEPEFKWVFQKIADRLLTSLLDC
jgi:hypothetical protein